ncbi:MAG: bifunctional 5,10-methylenetetrahydrofolate dehydrogenase/5,10-methenyltetrahydrofolate cyclohydrolase [Candidatus Woesearchaeota archaeon]|nr:bifunctional 5,10-methylenetetrahydrofolate dehydrogenase/5,10-methenyltetrahydrofolate cyclohydrolase [Candidatus Woesearchaeota archaeon]
MTVTLLDGKKVAQHLQQELKKKIQRLKKKPHLVAVLVGDDPLSTLYVNTKEKACANVGILSSKKQLSATISEQELIKTITTLNTDVSVTGILVQLPLPPSLDSSKILSAIDPKKDVDGMTPFQLGTLALGKEELVSCTAKGIIALLDFYKIPFQGKHVVIINHSILIGKPLILLLLQRNATVTVCHAYTQNLEALTLQADILISGVGKPAFIKPSMVKKGAVVVDVGISKTAKGIVGDVDFKEVSAKASFITPVPGGVGPMTIAILLQNTYASFLLQSSQ